MSIVGFIMIGLIVYGAYKGVMRVIRYEKMRKQYIELKKQKSM